MCTGDGNAASFKYFQVHGYQPDWQKKEGGTEKMMTLDVISLFFIAEFYYNYRPYITCCIDPLQVAASVHWLFLTRSISWNTEE